ncbi:MAG TPA: DUF4157 domain-containing protein [Pyrinomonadaceae bacterium]|nr:DUF4157 domain-containing protein [Pyrinomonadaceae bacterium]
MSKQAQHPKHFSSRLSIEPLKNGAVRQSAFQPKATGLHPQHVAHEVARKPLAPPAYRPQHAPPTAQAKMRASERLTPTRTPSASGGIVQANIIGGTHALQARLAFLKHAPGRHHTPQTIQRKSGPGVEAFQVPLQPKSGGQPIPDQVRAKMETAFGMDFSDVRVHVGQEASSIGAIAYTWGTNIHFAPGQYNPHTIQGQKLLGHELWHVVQQKSGRVSNPFGGGVAVVQDHALEAEADRMGIKAAMTVLVQ